MKHPGREHYWSSAKENFHPRNFAFANPDRLKRCLVRTPTAGVCCVREEEGSPKGEAGCLVLMPTARLLTEKIGQSARKARIILAKHQLIVRTFVHRSQVTVLPEFSSLPLTMARRLCVVLIDVDLGHRFWRWTRHIVRWNHSIVYSFPTTSKRSTRCLRTTSQFMIAGPGIYAQFMFFLGGMSFLTYCKCPPCKYSSS